MSSYRLGNYASNLFSMLTLKLSRIVYVGIEIIRTRFAESLIRDLLMLPGMTSDLRTLVDASLFYLLHSPEVLGTCESMLMMRSPIAGNPDDPIYL